MRLYQTATINGVKMPPMRRGDTSGERWQNLILPLLPFSGEGRVFTELGSNAGYYLREAKDLGFEAIGIEKEPEFVKQAQYWEEQEPKGVKTFEGDLNDYFPASSLVLVACVHYWLTPPEVRKLVKNLLSGAVYVLVVSRKEPRRSLKSPCDIETLRKNFSEFEEVKSTETDKHYSVLFKNPYLEERDTEAVITGSQIFKTKVWFPAFMDFLDGREEMYLRYTKRFKWRARDKTLSIKEIADEHIRLYEDIKERGIIEPILVDGGQVINGNHRLVIAHKLGVKKIICQQLRV